MALNTIMGTYTYFVNPLDLCAVALRAVNVRMALYLPYVLWRLMEMMALSAAWRRRLKAVWRLSS